MIIRVTGLPELTIVGTNYTASVPVSSFDDNGWADEQTNLTVAGTLSDTAASFVTKLKAAASTWQTETAIYDTMLDKLKSLVGKTL